jgi:hypothetical protein
MKNVTIIGSPKGGVGKTTIAVALADRTAVALAAETLSHASRVFSASPEQNFRPYVILNEMRGKFQRMADTKEWKDLQAVVTTTKARIVNVARSKCDEIDVFDAGKLSPTQIIAMSVEDIASTFCFYMTIVARRERHCYLDWMAKIAEDFTSAGILGGESWPAPGHGLPRQCSVDR